MNNVTVEDLISVYEKVENELQRMKHLIESIDNTFKRIDELNNKHAALKDSNLQDTEES